MSNALVTIDASRRIGEKLLVHRPHELFLFRYHFGIELVAMLTILGIVFLELRPHHLGKAKPFLLERFLAGNNAARLLDRVVYAGLRLVPEQFGIVVRDVAIVTACSDTGGVGMVPTLSVFLSDPMHRMARATTELVRAGCRHHDLSPNDASGTDQKSDDDKREDGPSRARRRKALPQSRKKPALTSHVLLLFRWHCFSPRAASARVDHRPGVARHAA